VKSFRVCIAGKNDIAVNSTDYLINKLRICKKDIMVIPNTTDAGRDTWQKSLRKFAIDNDIRIVYLDNIFGIENLVFISLEFDKLINPRLFKSRSLFNIHFSLLPRYKGVYTSIFPILNGENEAGVTLHLIDEGIDTGDIIAQKRFPIDINDTSRDLYFKFLHYGFELYIENIENLLSNDFNSFLQSNIGASYFSRKSIDFNKIEIDFSKTSFEVHNQIRAFIFKEYQLPEINGVKVKKSILTNEKIEKKYFNEIKEKFIISGTDGLKIEVFKA